MNIHTAYGWFLPWFRRRRMRRFLLWSRPASTTKILDVGGYAHCWSIESCPAQITILNLDVAEGQDAKEPYKLVKGDGRSLEFPDQTFDIACSNSVIEHLSTFADQEKFAREVRRVGRRVWVQTPARWFPIEPHLLTPCIHYLPKKWQRKLVRNFTVWGLITRPSQKQVDDFLAEVRLLTMEEMRRPFPDCQIRRERFLGLTKAIIAVR